MPVSDFQHEAVGRLGQFIAQVQFWRMHPAPELVASLPEGAGANVLAERDGDIVVQLIGGVAGQRIELRAAPGSWAVRWVDPSTGSELGRSRVPADAQTLLLNLPQGPEHRVAHLIRNRE
jgi:hypothetical protein